MSDLSIHAEALRVAAALPGNTTLPWFLLNRVGATLAGDSIEFADLELTVVEQGRLSGEVVVFTPTRIIEAKLDDSPSTNPDGDSSATVKVATHSRSRIVRATIAGTDLEWFADPKLWPATAKLRIVTADDKVWSLPWTVDHSQREAFHAFYPTILRDVGGSAQTS